VREFAELPGVLRAAARAMDDHRPVLSAMAYAYKAALLDEARAATGGDLRLSHVGRRGARVAVRYTVNETGAVVAGTGPWGILEKGARPHRIDRRRRRGATRGALRVGARFYASVRHPGAPARHAWTNGVKAGAGPAAAAGAKAVTDAVRRVL
jgi:hypothetical protein